MIHLKYEQKLFKSFQEYLIITYSWNEEHPQHALLTWGLTHIQEDKIKALWQLLVPNENM